MNIDTLLKEYYKVMQLNGLEDSDDDKNKLNRKCLTLKEQIEEEVKKVEIIDTLVGIINRNNDELFMPIDTMFTIHQRAITLKPKS